MNSQHHYFRLYFVVESVKMMDAVPKKIDVYSGDVKASHVMP
jgi:hypothetical protein